MSASNNFQTVCSAIAVLLVIAALIVSAVVFSSFAPVATWDDTPALADNGKPGIGGG